LASLKESRGATSPAPLPRVVLSPSREKPLQMRDTLESGRLVVQASS